MKLIVPYVGELNAVDSRMIRLAGFLGVQCESLALPMLAGRYVEYLQKAVPDPRACFVVNPRVMGEWIGEDTLPADLLSCLLSRFSHVIVHGLRQHACDENTVSALSLGRVQSVRAAANPNSHYEIAKNAKDVCGVFAGLSFGPANPANDRVFSCSSSAPAIRTLISIGGDPFMALMRLEGTEIFFLASEDVADLTAEVGDEPVNEFFSRLVPQAMALRHIFGEECWHPGQAYASIIIDDPLLRRNYGHLNFESLLRSMKQHNFHTTVAFIPHNFRRNSAQITRMFRENADRFGLCFHGNDHTGAEFAVTDTALLNSMLQVAEKRMKVHREKTGLDCERVMVFPQGNFSEEAMRVLKSRNFCAAANTVTHPRNRPVRLTIGELARPAVLRYGGFPLFLRKPIRRTLDRDIAFDVFFGKPVLIVEHHDIFRCPEALAEVAAKINAIVPEICWTSLANIFSNSILTRRAQDGAVHVQAYSGTIRISNGSNSSEHFSIEWNCEGACPPVENVLQNGTPLPSFEAEDGRIRISATLAPGSSHTFSVVYRNEFAMVKSLGLSWNAKAFVRRRLSELRDNYLSKNPGVLAVARTLQRRVLH